jgi:predicted dithiol-disulfide oxidoreductase (DUF899 family)
MSKAPLKNIVAEKERQGWTVPWVSAHESEFLFDYGFAFRGEEMAGIVREEFDMGQLLREASQWLRDYREEVGAPDLQSAVSVSAGWSVFAIRDRAAYNTYRVYRHSRTVTRLFSGLLELLPACARDVLAPLGINGGLCPYPARRSDYRTETIAPVLLSLGDAHLPSRERASCLAQTGVFRA